MTRFGLLVLLAALPALLGGCRVSGPTTTTVEASRYAEAFGVVEDTLRQLFAAMTHVLQAYLQATGQSAIVTQVLVPLVASPLGGWLAQVLTDALAWLHDPNNAGKIQRFRLRA